VSTLRGVPRGGPDCPTDYNGWCCAHRALIPRLCFEALPVGGACGEEVHASEALSTRVVGILFKLDLVLPFPRRAADRSVPPPPWDQAGADPAHIESLVLAAAQKEEGESPPNRGSPQWGESPLDQGQSPPNRGATPPARLVPSARRHREG
jgi:hypothetical protein